jgi:hypothetical protein
LQTLLHYKEVSNQAVRKTKMRTTFIGALSEVEDNFGYLWGHGKTYEELTDTERKFKKLWDTTRNNILNNGNNQYRSIEKEMNSYDIEWQRHSLTMPVLMEDSNEE